MSPDRLHVALARPGDPALDAVRAIASAVATRGHACRAWIVGGWVRDVLLGRETPDVDVEVHGVSADALERLLEELFPGRINTVGRSFGIFKVHVGHAVDVDVALPRVDSKTGAGHKGFRVTGDPLLGLKEAARRRDFTVNAMAVDPCGGELADPWGGIDDLAAKRLRIVDPASFGDDPLRVWRGVQLSARLEMTLDPATHATMASMVARGDLAELSRERVTDELKKLLVDAARPSLGLALSRELGIVARHYPELEALAATPQEPEWHPEGDVWTHTLMVVDQACRAARRPEWGFGDVERLHVAVGALLHDLGKPLTTTRALKDGVRRVVSPRHEIEGEAPARVWLDRHTFGEDAERAAIVITLHHYQPYALYRAFERGEMNEAAYVNAVRRLVKRIHPVPWRVFLCATEGDWRGRAFEDVVDGPYPAGEAFARTVVEHALDVEPVKPLVQGRDVLELGIAPGPRVGELIDAVEQARDRGQIATRDQALALLRTLV